MPRVSVIMPTYNAMPYLRTALESIRSQTLRDIEVIVLNDCSTDDTASYLDSVDDSRVQVIHCEKQGYVPLLNLGLRLAQGDLVARMDADDVSLPSRLQQQLDFMQQHADVVVCGCQAVEIDSTGRTIRQMGFPITDVAIRFQLMLHSAIPHPGAMYRRREILALGGYDTSLMPAEDYDLWCRASSGMKLANLPDILLHYRVHEANVSAQKAALSQAQADAIAVDYLIDGGYAASEDEARSFRRFLAGIFNAQVTTFDIDAATPFKTVIQRFVSAQRSPGCSSIEIEQLTCQLRWHAIQKARCSRSPLCAARWVRLARWIDPKGTRFLRLLWRASASLLRREACDPALR